MRKIKKLIKRLLKKPLKFNSHKPIELICKEVAKRQNKRR